MELGRRSVSSERQPKIKHHTLHRSEVDGRVVPSGRADPWRPGALGLVSGCLQRNAALLSQQCKEQTCLWGLYLARVSKPVTTQLTSIQVVLC